MNKIFTSIAVIGIVVVITMSSNAKAGGNCSDTKCIDQCSQEFRDCIKKPNCDVGSSCRAECSSAQNSCGRNRCGC